MADFIARYGKSQTLAALVTFLIALFGIMPYIASPCSLRRWCSALTCFNLQTILDGVTIPLLITSLLAIFAILFGTCKLDATEHNPGMMLTPIGFESGEARRIFIGRRRH